MRLIITGVSIDEKEVSILDHKLHKVQVDIVVDRTAVQSINILGNTILEMLIAYQLRLALSPLNPPSFRPFLTSPGLTPGPGFAIVGRSETPSERQVQSYARSL